MVNGELSCTRCHHEGEAVVTPSVVDKPVKTEETQDDEGGADVLGRLFTGVTDVIALSDPERREDPTRVSIGGCQALAAHSHSSLVTKHKHRRTRSTPAGFELWRQFVCAVTGPGNEQLKRLELNGCGVGDDLVEMLCVNVVYVAGLEVWNLSSNEIGNTGLRAIARYLRADTHLRELQLQNQQHHAGPEVEAELLDALETNTHITEFGYDFTRPTDRARMDAVIAANLERQRNRRRSGEDTP